MINNIKYYYNIDASNIIQIDEDYYFDNYVLKYYYRTIDINLYNKILNSNNYIHQIIYNTKNEYVTIIDNKPYVLLLILKKEKITLDIIRKSDFNLGYQKINWATLWMTKVDYYENRYDDIKDEKLKESFNYYIGMTENAIILARQINNPQKMNLCHLRLNNDIDYDSPFNIIIDHKMRDYAEYLKYEFFHHNRYYYDYINRLIDNYSYNDVLIFFIRMLYPSYYYDELDRYLKKEKVDYNFFLKINSYEKYLKYIYYKIKNKYNIINISWLK